MMQIGKLHLLAPSLTKNLICAVSYLLKDSLGVIHSYPGGVFFIVNFL
jgi:hypothetical protein